MSEDRVAKRPREDDTDVSVEPSTKRCESVWYEDGNIILQAEKTQFRVHKSILAAHSEVLRDMFSLPQPVEQDVACPVVLLEHDMADSWEAVFHYKQTIKFPFSLIRSIITLSHKYPFPHLYKEAERQLEATYPTKFEKFRPTSTFFSGSFYLDDTMSYCDILNTCIVRIGKAFVFDGTVSQGGTVSLLSPSAQRLLILGRDRLYGHITSHLFGWLWAGKPANCKCNPSSLSDPCRDSYRAILELVCKPVPSIALAFGSFPKPPQGNKICPNCLAHGQECFKAGQKHVWDNLPGLFDLPPWEELNEKDH
ncbi:hypothetical protein FA15DRAFT_747138 [Coprinopsis marcescibilis]|uniref:BTB domain-containing protein n=1 Tax=Coprinopsis marcescibilis TaxID=230819 RepID=A0A5C3KSW7_COPMA|nr:hypothetical protein FA15DRAFT_747138 [Coprinopsis marcescibilis]